MRTQLTGWMFVALGCGSAGAVDDPSGSEGTGSAGSTSDDGSGTTTSEPESTSDASSSPADSTGGSDDGSSESTGEPSPTATAACNGDGVCDRDQDETCAACPDECGSCEIEDLPDQRAKYVDPACPNAGDGSLDTCAEATGGAGRFNELQTALDSLVAGDTLYLHPGDYWREVPTSDSGATYTIGEQQDGSAAQPIVVTAADRDAPPVLHSCNPDDVEHCPAPAIAAYGDHIILDHLAIRGRAQLWGGTSSTMQYLDCSHGWGACGDGNWSCLRIESSIDGHAHHNYVHDLSGAGVDEACEPGQGSDAPDRGCGLKEFSSDGAVWELNTVVAPPRWAYDLHRNSQRTTVRFNEFRDIHQGIVVSRTVHPRIYGNLLVGRAAGAETCIGVSMLDEGSPGVEHLAEVHHNVCIGAQAGIAVEWEIPAAVHDNVLHGMVATSESPRNVVIEVIDGADHNAYDTAADFRRQTYDGAVSATLAEWQADTGHDLASIAAPGGACTFVDAPGDLHIVDGPCATLGSDGGPVGAYALTSCVGHACG